MTTDNEVLGMEGCVLTPTEWDKVIKKARHYHGQERSSVTGAKHDQVGSPLLQEGKGLTE